LKPGKLRKPILIILLLTLLWAGCQKKDEAQLIRENLENLVRIAEKRDRDRVLSYLSPDYVDFQGRDLRETAELVDYYFKNYSGIVIHLLDFTTSLNGDWAQVEADVLLSSGPLEALRKLVGLAGEFYRFDFHFKKEGQEWKISYSAWRKIESGSLLPGSETILKKLFPEMF